MTQPLFLNYCKWSSTTGGTGSFNVGAAAAADDAGPHATPVNSAAINGNTYRYYAQSTDGTQTELGRGVYSSGVLARTEVIANSLSTTALINFSTAPIVDMFPNPAQLMDLVPAAIIIPAGSRTIWQQAAAPTGWTSISTFNDYTIRINSGSGASNGGSMGVSSAFTYRTADGAGLSIAMLANHAHGDNTVDVVSGSTLSWDPGTTFQITPIGVTTGAAGSGAAHAHTYDMRVAYVDFTLASKN